MSLPQSIIPAFLSSAFGRRLPPPTPLRRRISPRRVRPCSEAMPPRVGDEVTGTVTRTMAYGAFVDLGNGHTGLLHISELSRSYVRDVSAHVKTGQRVRVRVMDVDEQGRRISLSLKRAEKIKATGYERVVQLGGDWGHPWGDGEDAKFLDLGPRPLPGPHHWQPDPKLFEEWEDDDGKPIFREGGNIKQDDMDEDEEGRGNR